jgi:hypothetical protein
MMDDDEFEAVGGMIGWENRNTRRRPASVSLCPLTKGNLSKKYCNKAYDRLCGLVVGVPGYRRCIELPVRYELNLYMLCTEK